MSEEEVKEILYNLSVDKYIDERKLDIKDVEAILTLLDLYNKEKEKKDYYKECLEVVSKELDNIDYDQILFAINDRFISKDKIKEKIEELEAMSISGDIYYDDILKMLQELLQEGDK